MTGCHFDHCMCSMPLDTLVMPLSSLPDLQLLGSPAHQHWLPRMHPLPAQDRMCTWVREDMGRHLQRKTGREGGVEMGGKEGERGWGRVGGREGVRGEGGREGGGELVMLWHAGGGWSTMHCVCVWWCELLQYIVYYTCSKSCRSDCLLGKKFVQVYSSPG